MVGLRELLSIERTNEKKVAEIRTGNRKKESGNRAGSVLVIEQRKETGVVS